MKEDPVLWAKHFIKTFDAVQKKVVPWTARWYQEEMLKDKSMKIVARCGRRTGKTETMCIRGLHKAYMNSYNTVLYVTPYENQVRLIFGRLKELINESPLLKSQVKKITMSPFAIEFNNNSTIKGFTTGAASGSSGASIRGQKADEIYMDKKQ